MPDPLPLPLDSNYHLLSYKRKQRQISTIHYDLKKFRMLLLTVNWNPCHPWAFQIMVYKCGQ